MTPVRAAALLSCQQRIWESLITHGTKLYLQRHGDAKSRQNDGQFTRGTAASLSAPNTRAAFSQPLATEVEPGVGPPPVPQGNLVFDLQNCVPHVKLFHLLRFPEVEIRARMGLVRLARSRIRPLASWDTVPHTRNCLQLRIPLQFNKEQN